MSGKDLRPVSAWDGRILRAALAEALRKLDPRAMVRNPVMFVVEVGSVLTTLVWLRDLLAPAPGTPPLWFTGQVALGRDGLGRIRGADAPVALPRMA